MEYNFIRPELPEGWVFGNQFSNHEYSESFFYRISKSHAASEPKKVFIILVEKNLNSTEGKMFHKRYIVKGGKGTSSEKIRSYDTIPLAVKSLLSLMESTSKKYAYPESQKGTEDYDKFLTKLKSEVYE